MAFLAVSLEGRAFLSNVAQQALHMSPNVSSRLIAEWAFSPPNLTGRRVWHKSRLPSGWEARLPQIWGQFCSTGEVALNLTWVWGLWPALRGAFSAKEIKGESVWRELACARRPREGPALSPHEPSPVPATPHTWLGTWVCRSGVGSRSWDCLKERALSPMGRN